MKKLDIEIDSPKFKEGDDVFFMDYEYGKTCKRKIFKGEISEISIDISARVEYGRLRTRWANVKYMIYCVKTDSAHIQIDESRISKKRKDVAPLAA